MKPIEELMYQWADTVNGKVGPLGYPSQSTMESIYCYKLAGETTIAGRAVTAAGKATRSMKGDRTPEWPDTVRAIDEAMLSLLASDKRAFYALVGFYLHKVPGRLRQDGEGLARGWRVVGGQGENESKVEYVRRLARAMPWNISERSYFAHLKRGEESVAAFVRGADWAA